MESIVQIEHLSRSFGRTQALHDVTLDVPRGCVFGLVGENGAGKTTLLKHILGLYRPQAGTVRVAGLAPCDDPVAVLAQIGYLSEDRALPEWMTVSELQQYTSSFYPNWDWELARDLQDAFELSPRQRAASLSRGQRARLGLLLALAHRPTLLVLDEPSSGLDPLVRRDVLGEIIRTVADEGRTVLFSSHLLDEVQRVSDHFALLQQGELTVSSELDRFLETHHRLTIRFAGAQPSPPPLTQALSLSGSGHEWTALCDGPPSDLEHAVRACGGEIVEHSRPSLEEIFVARATPTARRPV